jgi:hypothetical protein
MSEKQNFRQRALHRVAEAAASSAPIDELKQRVASLEAEVQENRQLNVRIAELVDLVQELLLPVASQDPEKIKAATEKFSRSL